MTPKELTEALGGRWVGSYGTARCPAHDDKRPSLTIRTGDNGRPLVYCQSGCASEAVLGALRVKGLWEGRGGAWEPPTAAEIARQRVERLEEQRKRSETARALYRASRPIRGTPAETYLHGRGITGDLPPTLRYHFGLKHAPTGMRLPALVAAVSRWPGREVVAVHRTFLTSRGKPAPVSEQKLALGPCQGGAVRLGPLDHAKGVLGLAEGIETGMAASLIFGVPVWACLGTSGLAGVQVPSAARNVLIFADHDESGAGEAAARKLQTRLEAAGHAVEVRMPAEPGDFADLLEAEAAL